MSGTGTIRPNKALLDAGATMLETHGAFWERQPPDCFCFVASGVVPPWLLLRRSDRPKEQSSIAHLTPATWPLVRETSSDAVGSSAAPV